MGLRMFGLLPVLVASFALAIEPTPKSPSKEKVEDIQRSGGALKIQDKPAQMNLNSDPAMRIIEDTADQNRQTLPIEVEENYWGPSFQVGIPHPLNLGLHFVHSSKLASAELSAGLFELQNVQDTDIELQNQEINLRWHPFRSAFFVGYGYGKQKVEAKGEEVVSGQKVKATVTFESDYSLPHLGWMSGLDKGGFFWAFEIGWQMPSNGKTKVKTNIDLTGNPDYDELIQDTRDTVKKAGKKPIPNLTLIKFGWLF